MLLNAKGAGVQMSLRDTSRPWNSHDKGRSIDDHEYGYSRSSPWSTNACHTLFADADPLTKRISLEELIPGGKPGERVELQIVGVFHNVRSCRISEDVFRDRHSVLAKALATGVAGCKNGRRSEGLIKGISAAIKLSRPGLAACRRENG